MSVAVSLLLMLRHVHTSWPKGRDTLTPPTETVLPRCRFEEFAATGAKICPLDIELKWMTEVSSSVYATPLITDLYADGRKDIIVPGVHHAPEAAVMLVVLVVVLVVVGTSCSTAHDGTTQHSAAW